MSVVYLYHSEDSEFGGDLSAASKAMYALLDQYAYMFGGRVAAIHPDLSADEDYPHWAPERYATLEYAQAAYPDHTWVYLSPTADKYLEDAVIPVDNVVYVVGHDRFGYGSSVLGGLQVKIRTLAENFEGHAIPCLVYAVCAHWSK